MIRVFLDTDVGNDIDDQYAIAYAVRHPNLRVEAIGATFFTVGSGDLVLRSMELARTEAAYLLGLLGRPDIPVYRGQRDRIASKVGDDAAAHAIIELAHASAGDDLLHVISIGAQSNLARALQLDPSISPRIRAVFIDGDYPWAPGFYNLPNDIDAVQTLYDSDCAYLHVPAPSVSGDLALDTDRARGLFVDGDPVGEHLLAVHASWQEHLAVVFRENAAGEPRDEPFVPVIWDVAAIAAVARPDLATTTTDGAPLIEHDASAPRRHRVTPRPDNPRRVEVLTSIDAEGIWTDFRDAMANSASSAEQP